MAQRRSRGFTLVELMAVVTIIAVIATLAIMSVRRTRSAGDADAWANQIRNTATFLRRRAASTGTPYALELGATSIAWCQLPTTLCSAGTPPSCASATDCTGSGTVCEKSPRAIAAQSDAITDSWANVADETFRYGGNVVAPTATHIAISGSGVQQLFFGPVGSVDDACPHVLENPPNPSNVPGVTIYVRASNATATATSEQQKHRRIVLYGVTGRPRIIDNW